MSLPNQNSSDGGLMRRNGATACGSTVPSHGAAMATKIIIVSTMPPAIAVGWRRSASFSRCQVGEVERAAGSASAVMSVAYPRIEQHVAQVHRQIDQHVRRGKDEDHTLNDRIVAPQDRAARQSADSGYRKNRLGDDRAADQ